MDARVACERLKADLVGAATRPATAAASSTTPCAAAAPLAKLRGGCEFDGIAHELLPFGLLLGAKHVQQLISVLLANLGDLLVHFGCQLFILVSQLFLVIIAQF